MRKTGAIRCKGGVPTSLDESGQQWDFPNAWPPLQHILVAGLLKTENAEARKMALTIARRLKNIYKPFLFCKIRFIILCL